MNDQHIDVLQWVGNGLIMWAAVVGVASVAVHLRVRWWATEVGRHLLAYMLVIAAVLVLSTIRIIFGGSWWFQVVRLITFAGVPLVMMWRLKLQIQAQRRRPSHLREV